MALTYHLPKSNPFVGDITEFADSELMYFTELKKPMKILIATEKPFAKKALDGIKEILSAADYEVALLEKYTEKEELIAAVKDVDGMIVRSDKVTAEVIEAAEQLKIVVRAGAGFDNVDLKAASARGIVVMNTPGQNSNAVAELALAMMIYMSRNRFTPGTGFELQGKTWKCINMTNVDIRQQTASVRLTFKSGNTVIFTNIFPQDAATIQPPVVTAPEGKVFDGWYRQDIAADGSIQYTLVFAPDETGIINLPAGTKLEPMILYALFVDAQ
jgi:hypothetical protein